MKKITLPDLPEFSEQNYSLAGYVVAAFVSLAGLFFIYEVLFVGDLTFKANWNIFTSPLGSVCIFIGFFCALAFWGKMGHWSRTPVLNTYDSSGNLIKSEKNYDIMEVMLWQFAMPLIGHFILEPIIYGCIIYYPLQVIIALVGSIFPYVLSLLVLAIIAGSWLFTKHCHFRYHSWALVIMGVLFCVAFGWGGYAIHTATPGSTIQMLADTPQDGDVAAIASDGDDEENTDDMMSNGDDGADANDGADEATTGDNGGEDDFDDQFGGEYEEGLLGALPQGTTAYEGDMGGFPIEVNITKKDDGGTCYAMYRNVKFNATMRLEGESLPAMGGDISFYGKDSSGSDWNFQLTGNADDITGTAYGDGKELPITLHRK